MSQAESEALEQLGQAHEEGRVLPAPEMVLFTGETALKVKELSDLMQVSPQEVIGVALQQLYDRIQESVRQKREEAKAAARGETYDRQAGGDASQDQAEPDNRDPFRPH